MAQVTIHDQVDRADHPQSVNLGHLISLGVLAITTDNDRPT